MEQTIVTMTLTTVVSFLALLVGGMLGWMARQHSYETTPQVVYTHPEMYDENGNLVPDEILAVRFETIMTQTPKTKRKSSTVVAKTPRKRVAKSPALPPNPFVHEILEYVGKQNLR